MEYIKEKTGGRLGEPEKGDRCCVHTILLAKACKHRGEESPPLCLFLFSALLSHTAFPCLKHWRIESALEFHPLYCKEDLVLLNTSCLLFFHRLVTASWGAVGDGGEKETQREGERCTERGVGVW
jgi:hypothetical protein